MSKFTIEINDTAEGVEYTGTVDDPVNPGSPTHQFAAALRKFPEMLPEFMQTAINKLGESDVTPVTSDAPTV